MVKKKEHNLILHHYIPLCHRPLCRMNHRRIVQVSLGIRIGIAVLTRTVFQPDEYFQSLEPAFRVVFGHGHLTWEWLSQNPIRSIIYPALNIPVYWLLKATGLAHTGWLGDWLLVSISFSTFLPFWQERSDTTSQSLAWYIWRSHGHLAMWIGAGDVGKRLCFDCGTLQKNLYPTWSCLIHGQLFLSLSSFFHVLSLSRSMSNSLETSLSTMAFAYYPWDVSSTSSPGVLNRCVPSGQFERWLK